MGNGYGDYINKQYKQVKEPKTYKTTGTQYNKAQEKERAEIRSQLANDISYWSQKRGTPIDPSNNPVAIAENYYKRQERVAEVEKAGQKRMNSNGGKGKYSAEDRLAEFKKYREKDQKTSSKAYEKEIGETATSDFKKSYNYSSNRGINESDVRFEAFMDKQKKKNNTVAQLLSGTNVEENKKKEKGFLQKALEFGKSLTAFDDANFKESRAKTGGDKEGAERFASRTANSVLLGLPAQLEKSVTGEVAPYQTARKFGDGKGTDTAADLLGYLVPGVGIAKGLRGTSLGAKGLGALAKQPLTKETAKQIAKQTAKEGASVGAIMSGAEIAGRETLNPEDYNWKQNLAQFGLETGAGAVLDPAVTLGLGKLLSKIKKPPIGNTPVEKSIQETLAELPPPPQRGPQPRNPGEPLQGLLEQISVRPVGKELAATTTKQRPGIEGLMKAYKGQDVSNVSSALSKQADNGMPKNAYESISDAPVKKDEVFKEIENLKENIKQFNDNLPKLKEVEMSKLDSTTQNENKRLMDEYVQADDLWKAAKEIQETFKKPSTRPEWAHFSVDSKLRASDEFSAIPNRFVAKGENKNHGTDFAKAMDLAGFKNETDFINHLQYIDSQLNVKTRKDLSKMDNTSFKAAEKYVMDLDKQIESQLKAQFGISDMEKQIDELSSQMKSREGTNASPNKQTVLDKADPVKDVAKENKELYKDMAEDAIRNSDLWKDKSPIFLSRETLERNFEDIAGKDDGKKLKEYYIQPVRQKETERIRFVNDQRKTVESFGMKAKSKDDQLVQMYGEGKISLENLKIDTPNWEKVIEVSDWYKENYNTLIDTANRVLSEAGEKTIPKRENYFPHYKGVDELFETLKKFGIDMENYSLPTGINGLTENFKPNKKFFANAMQRKTDETTFGAIEGFDRYIEGISQLIYHTENIKKLRALEGSLRNKYGESTHLTNLVVNLKEQGNLLAGKKAAADRYVEQHFGRKAYSVLDTIKQRTGLNMLGYNIGSASTAFIPLTHAAATTSKTAFAKGMMDTITNIVRKDGFADASGFLTRRVGSKPLVRSWWNKIENNSMGMMDLVDRFSSQTIVRGKYYELLEKGIPEKEALQQADDWAGRIMADRSKGQQPTLFASRTLGPIMQFQIEVNNQLSFLFKDIPKNAANKKELMSQMTQAVVYGYLANEVYEQVLGRRPSFDPIGVFMESYKNFSDSEMDTKEAATRTIKGVSEQLPFVSPLTGGRYPISAAIPNYKEYADGNSTLGKELIKPAKFLLAPSGGSQAFKTYEGNKVLNERGVYKNGKLKYPVDDSPENVLKGLFLGPGSFPETNAYYDKPYTDRRTPLTIKQTEEVDNSSDRQATYEKIVSDKKLRSLFKKLDEASSKKEKENLMKRINFIKGGE